MRLKTGQFRPSAYVLPVAQFAQNVALSHPREIAREKK